MQQIRSAGFGRAAAAGCLAIFWLLILTSLGSAADSPSAAYSVSIHKDGKAQSSFSATFRSALLPAQVEALSKALGSEIKERALPGWDAEDEDSGDDDDEETARPLPPPPGHPQPVPPRPNFYVYSSQGTPAIVRHQGRSTADFDFQALLAELKSLGVSHLRVLISHPSEGESDCTKGTGDLPPVLGEMELHSLQISTDDPALSSVHVSYGYSSGYLLKRLWPFAALLVLPLGLSISTRLWMVRQKRADAARTAFVGGRLINGMAIVLPLVWSAAILISHADRLAVPLLGPRAEVLRGSFAWVILVVPPLVITILCLMILQPALARVRDPEPKQTASGKEVVAVLASGTIPWFLGLQGFYLIMDRKYAIGAACLIGAYLLRLALGSARRKAMGVRGYAVVWPALRKRVFALADVAGVALREVSIIPDSDGGKKVVNAFAVSDGRVYLSEVFLKKMSRREVDSIVAHELSHLQSRHGLIKRLMWWVVILAPALLALGSSLLLRPLVPPALRRLLSYEVIWLAGFAVAIIFHFYLSRHFEYAADRQGVALTGDPEAMIRALTKLAHLGQLPMNWSKLDEKLLTHPSHQRRIQEIARVYGIPPSRVEVLLFNLEEDTERYSVTDTAPEPPATAWPTANQTGTQSAAAGKKRPRSMLLYPLRFAIGGSLLGLVLAYSGGVRDLLYRYHVPPLVLAPVCGLIATGLACSGLKRKLLSSTRQDVEFLAARPEDYAGLDRESLVRYTTALETLGFAAVMDYTNGKNPKSSLVGFGRLFVNRRCQCMAEVNQVLAGSLGVTRMGCSIMSNLDDGTRLSSSDREPKASFYPYRLPNSLWVCHPEASPEALVREHLRWRWEITSSTGAKVREDLSTETYFADVRKWMKERHRVMRRKNTLVYLFEVDQFRRHPKLEWLGDHAKHFGRARRGQSEFESL